MSPALAKELSKKWNIGGPSVIERPSFRTVNRAMLTPPLPALTPNHGTCQ